MSVSVTLDASELAWMREVIQEYLPDTCTIRQTTRVPDGMGGWTETYTDVEDVPCRVDPVDVQARTALEGEQVTVHDLVRIVLAHDVGLDTDTYILWSGTWFDVVGVEDKATWLFCKAAVLRKRGGEP